MQTHEIPSNEWSPFFSELSKRHHGEHVTVELLGRDIGDQTDARDQSFLDISLDRPSGSCRIQVKVDEPDGADIAHEIAHPIRVRVAQNDDGRDAAIEIESDAGLATLLQFATKSIST